MFVTIEVLSRSDDEPDRYTTAVSFTEGMSIHNVCMVLAATLLALSEEDEVG